MLRPAGIVTFLLTDIEGSARLWESNAEAMRRALLAHDSFLADVVARCGGRVFKTLGDGVCAAFACPSDAIRAALEAQCGLLSSRPQGLGSPLRVRIAIHCGPAEEQAGDYLGPAVNRAARIRDAAHGGQILVSQSVVQLTRDSLPAQSSLRDLGDHRLKDLQQPERLCQLLHPDLPADFSPLRTLPVARHNLPIELTSFIGRESEMAEVIRLLDATRLLTLTGTGGCGKTRLALHAAAQVMERFPDGVWLVDLASLKDPALVPQAVARAVGVGEDPAQDLLETLADSLRSRSLLLVLDNCEHLVGRCALVAERLLKSCPDLRILATSRESLAVPGEVAWRVPSLELPPAPRASHPDRLAPAALEDLMRFSAVQLFVERAKAVAPSYTARLADVPYLGELCRRLDGIPLAIELAAARVRVLSLPDIVGHLDELFGLLSGGSRTVPTRQQTLAAAIQWSYDLLSERERTLLARLSAFAGGWDIEAAQSVCGMGGLDEWDVLDALTGLIDKSMVTVEQDETGTRYRLLETIRAYSARRLHASDEEAQIRLRHVMNYRELVERALPELTGANQSSWLNRIETEHGNIRAALDWWRAQREDDEVGLVLVGAMSRFWHLRGYYAEGRRRLNEAMGRARDCAPSRGWLLALSGAGILAYDQGDLVVARDAYERAVTVARELGDADFESKILGNLGLVAANRRDFDEAQRLFEAFLATRESAGDERGIAAALNNLGVVAASRGDLPAARAFHSRSLGIRRKLGDRDGTATALNDLGDAMYRSGDAESARRAFLESLALYRECGNLSGAALALQNLGHVALSTGDALQARCNFVEALGLAEQIGDARLTTTLASSLGDYDWHLGHQLEAAAWYARALAGPVGAVPVWSVRNPVRGAARCDAARARSPRAARLFGAAAGMDATDSGIADPAASRLRADDHAAMAIVHAHIDESEFENGGRLSLEAAAALAIESLNEVLAEGLPHSEANS